MKVPKSFLSLTVAGISALITVNAYAWLPKISEGQVFTGKIYKNGVATKKTCSVEIVRITESFDEASHCMGVNIRSSFDPEHQLYLVTDNIYAVESTPQPGQKSCAEALTPDANLHGPDAEDIWIKTISNHSDGPDRPNKYNKSGGAIRRSFTMTFNPDGTLAQYERYAAINAFPFDLFLKSRKVCRF